MENMSFGKFLEICRNKSGLLIKEAAIKSGLSPSYISMMEKGTSPAPSAEIAVRVADALSLAENDRKRFLELAYNERIGKESDYIPEIGHQQIKNTLLKLSSHISRVPVVSWVAANHFKTADDPFPAGVADEWIYTTARGKNIFALKVKGDCMQFEFNEDDLIIVDPHAHTENGDYIIAKDTNSESATFKQLKRYGDKVVLHPLNPKYQDIELDMTSDRYVIVGKVVEKIKQY